MKLWHDDIRRPPDETWHWARTNQEAMQILSGGYHHPETVSECSLDHDLGLHEHDPDVPDADMQRGWDEENDGFKLVEWMVANDLVPDKVTIHSWNPDGASRMASYIVQATMHGAISNRPNVIVKRYLTKAECS